MKRQPKKSEKIIKEEALKYSTAPRPGESFEAYHPSSIGVICVMIAWRLRAVKAFL
jgi:hypothetical protein